MKRVFTNGCFDILHRGHLELLKKCKELGYVMVGINSDESVRSLKGDGRPFFNQQDREFALRSLKYVDEVFIFNELAPYNLIKTVNPDIIVKGGDYTAEGVVGNDLAEVYIFNYIDGYSTTRVLDNK